MSDIIYNFRAVENKWINNFNSYSVSNDIILSNPNKKYYVLEMLPYPSGKLHMGHIRNYTIGDVIARIKRMQGYNVIHPMGWDAFGMPAENAAIQSGIAPSISTNNNITSMKNQLQRLGYMYDWKREVSTCNKEYYFEEQKLFLEFYKRGLVYRKQSYVNWDPVDNTVLANEQVINGRGWRSGAVVEKKLLNQWSMNITSYADRLLEGLKDLKGYWPDNVITMQENWIGKSEGALINFEIVENNIVPNINNIEVYSTRPDTIFGMSFIAISIDHEISKTLSKNDTKVSAFIEKCRKLGTTEEVLEKAEKLGYFTGIYIKHPVIKDKQIPVYIANFVLIDYGTGAVFGCPAHDERDYDFATKYNLPITTVIQSDNNELPYTGDGILINSNFLNGKTTKEAKFCIIDYLETNERGQRQTKYRLRDWLISRQRYWGCPIPIVHCPKCGEVPANLPVELPDDIDFKNLIGNPLEKHTTWKYTKCPKCGCDAIRDTDTLDTFFESSWYFLRYLDNQCNDPINKEITDISLPVDLYIGGVEHAVLHLLYARFFMLVLHDLGYSKHSMPFKKLLTQGMVCHKLYKNSDNEYVFPDDVEKLEDGTLIDNNGKKVKEYPSEKMSKSKKNIVNPQSIMESYGVDALRLFILSDTPPEKDLDWNTSALDGSWRFLNRIWKVFNQILDKINNNNQNSINNDLYKITNIYLQKIEENYNSISLNKSIALSRELFNKIEDNINTSSNTSLKFAFETFIKVFYPITPFICHEMWQILGNKEYISNEKWPEFDKNIIQEETVTIAIQVNGKLRKTIELPKDTSKDITEKTAIEAITSIDANKIKKIIVVPNRIVNIVV
ncbi:MAG: leucine--tRNA ligase [Alphaproteobacteria bacterium]|nr:leucine--tRNA ligase [Alphaproteobacteria bacterium]